MKREQGREGEGERDREREARIKEGDQRGVMEGKEDGREGWWGREMALRKRA